MTPFAKENWRDDRFNHSQRIDLFRICWKHGQSYNVRLFWFKKYWTSVYNRCASPIYTIWLQYNIVEISQDVLRSYNIYWDLKRSTTEISQDIVIWHWHWHLTFQYYICHLTFDCCHLTFDICHLPFAICHLPFAIWHLTFDIWHLTFDIWHLTFDIRH